MTKELDIKKRQRMDFVADVSGTFDQWRFPLNEAIDVLAKVRFENAAKYDRLELQVECRNEDEGPYFGIYGHRLETDEEVKARIEQEEKWRKTAEERDRETYKRLKERFEGKPEPELAKAEQ